MQSALVSAGDIAVTATELRATFALLSSPHRTIALATRCAALAALAHSSPARVHGGEPAEVSRPAPGVAPLLRSCVSLDLPRS